MMTKKIYTYIILLLLCLVGYQSNLTAQSMYTYSGIVTDSTSAESVPYASVFVAGTTIGTTTDSEGRFSLKSETPLQTITFAFIGYKDKTIKVRHEGLVGNIRLVPDNMLQEVVVKRQRVHYRRKNNPAVTLVKRMLEKKDSLDPRNADYFHNRCYTKQTLGMTNVDDMIERRRARGKDVSALESSTDTSEATGAVYIPLFIEEQISDNTHTGKRKVQNDVIDAKSTTIIEVIPEEAFSTLMADAAQEINIYDNDFRLLFTDFTSPIAKYGTAYYHYYITDTIKNYNDEGRDYIKVNFSPSIKENFGFVGYMLVAKDSTYGVRHIDMKLTENSRINFVQAMRIWQDFEESEKGFWTLKKSTLAMEGNPLESAQRIKGLFAKIERYYSPTEFEKSEITATENIGNDWEALMPDGVPEDATKNIDSLKAKAQTNKMMRFANFSVRTILDGYIPVGGIKKPWLHIGPIFSIISTNHLEGPRILLGAQTGTGLSPRWFAGGYAAYGFRDEKLKYMGEVEYSFIDKEKSRFEFPRKSIRASYIFDCDMPGNRFTRSRQGNLFGSFRWENPNQYAYFRRSEITHTYEFPNGISYSLSVRHNTEEAADELEYRHNQSLELVDNFKTTDFSVEVSFTPVQYHQLGLTRYTLTNQHPHISLTYSGASEKIWSDYTYNRLELCYDQRFSLAPVGYLDVFVKGGKVFQKVPYPLLFMPATNLSYFVGSESFYLMSNMEFINDQYCSVELKHCLDGWLLSRIPLINKLKLREFWSFRMLYGGLSDENNPRVNPNDEDLFVLPANSRVMSDKNIPYMEASVGLYNILKILQVEVVRRITYLDFDENYPNAHPNKWGIRFGTKITF